MANDEQRLHAILASAVDGAARLVKRFRRHSRILFSDKRTKSNSATIEIAVIVTSGLQLSKGHIYLYAEYRNDFEWMMEQGRHRMTKAKKEGNGHQHYRSADEPETHLREQVGMHRIRRQAGLPYAGQLSALAKH